MNFILLDYILHSASRYMMPNNMPRIELVHAYCHCLLRTFHLNRLICLDIKCSLKL